MPSPDDVGQTIIINPTEDVQGDPERQWSNRLHRQWKASTDTMKRQLSDNRTVNKHSEFIVNLPRRLTRKGTCREPCEIC